MLTIRSDLQRKGMHNSAERKVCSGVDINIHISRGREDYCILINKQVKPGFTKYQPQGLAKKNCSICFQRKQKF